MQGAEIEFLVVGGIEDALRNGGVSLDADHRRRLFRVLVRIACRLAHEARAPLSVVVAHVIDAFMSVHHSRRSSKARPNPKEIN